MQDFLNNASATWFSLPDYLRSTAWILAVTISLIHTADTLTVTIEDDGAGFEPELRALVPGSGMGLLCMEERARLLDGTLHITSAPGKGTTVRATLPVPPPGSPPIGRDGSAVRLPGAHR